MSLPQVGDLRLVVQPCGQTIVEVEGTSASTSESTITSDFSLGTGYLVYKKHPPKLDI